MNTITAKELRDNLGAIAKRVQAGEHLKVTYRNRPVFSLIPERPVGAVVAGSREAIDKYIKSVSARRHASGKPTFDPDKSVKELYREMLDNDPKYKPNYHK